MTNCGTCKHWVPYQVEESQREWGYFDIDSEEVPKRWGTCSEITHGWGSEKAFTLDASDYASSLRTRNDFGCGLWAASSFTKHVITGGEARRWMMVLGLSADEAQALRHQLMTERTVTFSPTVGNYAEVTIILDAV